MSRLHVTVHDCWLALAHVQIMGWIDFLIEEFVHYAAPANGNVHIVAPGHLLLFSSPVEFEDGRQWDTLSCDGGAPVRRFSAAFYADLFAELGVESVACLTESRTSTAAFAACGIDAVDLRPGHRHGQSILRALDGLLSLTRVGTVALHGGDGGAAGRWPLDAAVVVAALLVGRLRFTERSAYAWLWMLCPWLLAGRAGLT